MIILFDLDGTLIDSTDAIVDSFIDVFNFYDIKVPQQKEIIALIGHPLENMFIELGVQDNIDNLVLKYKEFYRPRSLGMTTLLPNAKKAIEQASKIARLGIVTTKVGERTHALLQNLEVAQHFEVIVGRDHVENPKPHPEPIFKALSQFQNVQKSKVFMIGDTFMDVVAANSADINSIGVLCGSGTKEHFIENNAKHICQDSLSAVKLIRNEYTSS